MRLLTAVMALSLMGAGGAEAADWFKGRKLPKPIDSPVVRIKVREDHKANKKQRHPPGPPPFASLLPASPIERA